MIVLTGLSRCRYSKQPTYVVVRPRFPETFIFFEMSVFILYHHYSFVIVLFFLSYVGGK